MNEELKQLTIIRTLLRSGNFELKGEAVPVMASSLSWLDKKIVEVQNAMIIANAPVKPIENKMPEVTTKLLSKGEK